MQDWKRQRCVSFSEAPSVFFIAVYINNWSGRPVLTAGRLFADQKELSFLREILIVWDFVDLIVKDGYHI